MDAEFWVSSARDEYEEIIADIKLLKILVSHDNDFVEMERPLIPLQFSKINTHI